MKKQSWQLFKFLQIFPSFQTFGQQYYKKGNNANIQEFTRNKFSQVFI